MAGIRIVLFMGMLPRVAVAPNPVGNPNRQPVNAQV